MRFLWKLLFAVIGNSLGLWAAANYVPGFQLSPDIPQIAAIALALTFLNILLRPILRLFLGPIIVLTLGLGAILVNALILGLLDFLAPGLNIQGVAPLFLGTLVLAAVNFVINIILT